MFNPPENYAFNRAPGAYGSRGERPAMPNSGNGLQLLVKEGIASKSNLENTFLQNYADLEKEGVRQAGALHEQQTASLAQTASASMDAIQRDAESLRNDKTLQRKLSLQKQMFQSASQNALIGDIVGAAAGVGSAALLGPGAGGKAIADLIMKRMNSGSGGGAAGVDSTRFAGDIWQKGFSGGFDFSNS
jgi:hypothetical protein